MAQWDDIVVGQGLLGTCVARLLADAGRRVLIVEGGHPVSEPHGSHVRNTSRLQDDPDEFFASIDGYFDYLDPGAPPAALPGAFTTSILGGLGIVWTNNCPRAVEGVDRPDVMSAPDWDSCYSVAEDLLGVSADQFTDSARGRVLEDRLARFLSDEARELKPLPLSGRREGPRRIHYTSPADVLVAGRRPAEIAEGSVSRIDLDGRSPSVVLDGDIYSAGNVVLAAGAIETPRLLWRSDLHLPALGRHLSYHPVLIGQVILDIEPGHAVNGSDPLPRLGISPTVDHPWFVMLLRDTNPLVPSTPDLNVDPNRLLEVQAFAPIDPHPDNRMRFDDDTITFDFPLREADSQRRQAIERDVDELCATLGRYRSGCEPQWAPLGTPHLMGSCRIGAHDDNTSVAEPTGRVHGTEHLYLATNGLISNRLAVNPTLTAAALAVRTANHLIES